MFFHDNYPVFQNIRKNILKIFDEKILEKQELKQGKNDRDP